MINKGGSVMGSYSFLVYWGISFVVLLIIAFLVGRATGQGILGILIDGRGRYSLTHFQIVLWTIIILSSVIGVFISHGFDPNSVILTPELLGLMGISAGSAVFSTGVKGIKDVSPTANVARAGTFKRSDNTTDTITAHPAQIWLEEEGDLADRVVNITKFQNFIFTLVILAYYVFAAFKIGGLPGLPESIVWLIGISHTGYVGGKVPTKK
jgi:hypothetical protein